MRNLIFSVILDEISKPPFTSSAVYSDDYVPSLE